MVDYSRSPDYPPYIALEVKNTTGSATGFPGCKLSIVDVDGCELTYCQLRSNSTSDDHLGSNQGSVLYSTLYSILFYYCFTVSSTEGLQQHVLQP